MRSIGRGAEFQARKSLMLNPLNMVVRLGRRGGAFHFPLSGADIEPDGRLDID